MNASEEKNGAGLGIGAVFDAAAGLLKNPAVIEGIITGISAVSASQRVKHPKTLSGGFDFGSVIELLPQILPLVSLFKNMPSSGSGTASVPEMNVQQVFSLSDDNDEAEGNSDVYNVEENNIIEKENEEMNNNGAETVFSEKNQYGNADISYGNKKEQRENLILAIRPFLSESRVAAADAMLEINRISEIFKS